MKIEWKTILRLALGVIGVILAFLCIAALGYMLLRPYKEATKLEKKLQTQK